MVKNTNFFERIMRIIDYKGFKSVNEFSIRGLNYKSSEKINRLKGGNKQPSVDILIDISNMFEEINPTWLLTGKGEMISKKEIVGSNEELVKSKEEINNLKNELLELHRENARLLKEKENKSHKHPAARPASGKLTS